MTSQRKILLALPNAAEPTIPYITLPPELLSMIFIACADPPPEPSGPLNPMHWALSERMQWIAVTHVCRYWRSVALGCADLWRRLFVFNTDVTKKMIRRSKGANLEVIIHDCEQLLEPINRVIEMVLPELHRVSVLYVALPKEPAQFLVDGFVHAAPKLEPLCLDCDLDKMVPIPDAIQTPALRSLVLQNRMFTSPSPSSSIFWFSNGPHSVNHSQIVSFLCQTPMLHNLEPIQVLQLSLPHRHLQPRPPPLSWALPHLHFQRH